MFRSRFEVRLHLERVRSRYPYDKKKREGTHLPEDWESDEMPFRARRKKNDLRIKRNGY